MSGLAISDGRFYLLQSRPVTVLGRADIGAGVAGKHVLFKPIFENFTDPVTPLTQDLFEVYAIPGVTFVRGWLYMDLDYLRRALPFKVSDQDLAQQMYSVSRNPPKWPVSFVRLPLVLVAGIFSWLAIAVLLARTTAMPDDALDGQRATCRRIEQDENVAPEETLARLWLASAMFRPLSDLVLLVNLVAFRFTIWMGVLSSLLERWAPGIAPEARTSSPAFTLAPPSST